MPTKVAFHLSIFTLLVIYCVQSVNTAPRRRATQPPKFLQTPQQNHYVSRNQPANLTWVATNVCKMQIKCNGKQFDEGRTGVCGEDCRKCRTTKETKVITFSDFPEDVRDRFMTCQCKIWGTIANRSRQIIVEKAFLGRNFGKVQLKHVASLNTTVVFRCKPPSGSPPPTVAWYKNCGPLIPRRGKRVQVTSKNDLVIRRLRRSDSGKYQCVAENMAARREGLVMTLELRENISTDVCNESQRLSIWELTGKCRNRSRSNASRSRVSGPFVLVFGTRNGLYAVDLSNTSYVRQLFKAENVVSLDFGLDPNVIYWTDRNGINRFSLHNGVSEDMPFHLDADSSIGGLVVGWLDHTSFWTDAKHDAIYLGDLRNGRKIKLVDDKLDSPRAIVSSHSEGYIYWMDWGPTPKIERARLDGTERTALIENGIQLPNALALDESGKMLFWAGNNDSKYGVIEAVSLDGLNRTVIFYREGYHPFSLDVHEGFLYWSDWAKNAILRVSKIDGGGEEVIVDGLHKPTGLKILHPRVGQPGPNPCNNNNGDCEYLCLHLTLLAKRKCFCKEEFKLSKNGKTCDQKMRQVPVQSTSKPSDQGTPPGLIILIILLMALIFLVYRFLKKRPPRPVDAPRRSREEIAEDNESSVLANGGREESDHAGTMIADAQLNDESLDLNREVCRAEPSVANAGREDSSVKFQHSVVNLVYNLTKIDKVEVEQPEVAIVGDNGKVNYRPQAQN